MSTSCYTNSLRLAVQHKLRTLAFPSISTGIYGYSREEAAVVASEASSRFLARDSCLSEARLIILAERDAVLFLKHQRFPVKG